MNDSASNLLNATRRAKSDVANKLVSMFLHELSRSISQTWPLRVDRADYAQVTRRLFGNRCPYCGCSLTASESVVEHLDGMNRYRAGLHLPGNVLVACKRCNGEKRRDDSKEVLTLAETGWESFLCHDGTRCDAICVTCKYWASIWPDDSERQRSMREHLRRIRDFRGQFPEFQAIIPELRKKLPALLTKLYSDCQQFAEAEIRALLNRFDLGIS